MNDMLAVGLVQRRGNRCQDTHDFRQWHRPLRGHTLAQRAARHVAHHQVGLLVELPKVVHRHNRRVLQRRNHARLVAEPRPHFGVKGQTACQQLDRHLPFHQRIACQIHNSHTATAELSFNFVPPNLRNLAHSLFLNVSDRMPRGFGDDDYLGQPDVDVLP